jgi:hypothetical protein
LLARWANEEFSRQRRCKRTSPEKALQVSCILVSHDKPEWCSEALSSVASQSHLDWECLVVDSGVLFDDGYFSPFLQEKRFHFIRSTETHELRRTKAMAPWCFNQCFREGRVNGDLVVYLCDDDLYYPNAFKTFVEFASRNPQAMAIYGSQDLVVIREDGSRINAGERRASSMGGRCCRGRILDTQVDYAQMAHRRSILKSIKGFDCLEWWPEGKETEGHADGIFMERIGAVTPFYPIDVKVSQNRRTPKSLNCPTEKWR